MCLTRQCCHSPVSDSDHALRCDMYCINAQQQHLAVTKDQHTRSKEGVHAAQLMRSWTV